MKVLLARPKQSDETIGLQHVMVVEPLELELLAASMDKSDTPVIVDLICEYRDVEYFIRREKPDIFCVTGYITNVPQMIGYCKKAKEINPAIVTVAGGVHCEVCPDDLTSVFIDYRVIRNAVSVFPRLLEYIKGRDDFPDCVLRASEKPGDCRLLPYNFDVPFADRSLTRRYRHRYFYIFHDRVALIKTSFGCPYSCSFCFCRQITGGIYHERPLREVVDELLTIKEKNIYIVDDDFLINRDRVVEFIRLCNDRNIRKNYLIYGRADFIANNPDVIKDFAKAGLRTIIVGIESFYDEELKEYNKKTSAATNRTAMAVLNENKIDCYATVIIPPGWSEKEFEYCGKELKRMGVHYVNLQPYTPLPGTGADVPEGSLLFSRTDFEKWDLAHVSIKPEKLPVHEFYGQIMNLYKKILFQPRFILRHMTSYNPGMQVRMITGSMKVWRQYAKKKERSRNA